MRNFKEYRQHLQGACARCGSNRFLVVHHMDENFTNDDPSNLETLCKRCHQIEHKCWENLPKEPRPVTYEDRTCEWCGKLYQRRLGYPKTRCCSSSCGQSLRHATSRAYHLSCPSRKAWPYPP